MDAAACVMADGPAVKVGVGLTQRQFDKAAKLYDQAFGQKFRVAITSRKDRIALFRNTFVGEFAVTANDGDELVGLAGFQTSRGSLTSGIDASGLVAHLGVLRGLRAMAIFSLYERVAKPGELVMDGIAVQKEYRGQGIGGKLLAGVVDYATKHGYETIRLDVIDTNPGAQRLYERKGFVAVHTETFFFLRWLLGFGASTTMSYRVTPARSKT